MVASLLRNSRTVVLSKCFSFYVGGPLFFPIPSLSSLAFVVRRIFPTKPLRRDRWNSRETAADDFSYLFGSSPATGNDRSISKFSSVGLSCIDATQTQKSKLVCDFVDHIFRLLTRSKSVVYRLLLLLGNVRLLAIYWLLKTKFVRVACFFS